MNRPAFLLWLLAITTGCNGEVTTFQHDGADAGSCIARVGDWHDGQPDDAPYCLVTLPDGGLDAGPPTIQVKVYTVPGAAPADGAGCFLYGGTTDGIRTWCCDVVPDGCTEQPQ